MIYVGIILSILIVLYWYVSYKCHKLNLEVIDLYPKIQTMSMRECAETREFLDSVKDVVKKKYIATALVFLALREKQLMGVQND